MSTFTSTSATTSTSTPTNLRNYDQPMDNLLSKQSRSLYKVLKSYTSPASIERGRRAATEFFNMYDNLPYGQEIRDALDEEDLLTIPPPFEMIDMYETPLEIICTCTCPKYRFADTPATLADDEPALPSTAQVELEVEVKSNKVLDLEIYQTRMGLEKVDVEAPTSFGIDFAHTPLIVLERTIFIPSFEVDVDSVLASMHAEAEAKVKAEAEAEAIKTQAEEAAKALVIKKVVKPTTTANKLAAEKKRRQTLVPSSTLNRVVVPYKQPVSRSNRVSLAPSSAANVNVNVNVIASSSSTKTKTKTKTTTTTTKTTTTSTKRQALVSVGMSHKAIVQANTTLALALAPAPAPIRKTNLKNRVSLAPMSKKERFADLGKGQYFIGGRD